MKITTDTYPTSLQECLPTSNELLVGKFTLTQLTQLVGDTPFYAYDRQLITNKVSYLKRILPDKISVSYAIKANPLVSLVHMLSQQVEGFDVASKKEMLLALQTGIPANKISFAGPGKSSDDIQAAIIAGVILHVESIGEIAKVAGTAKKLQLKAEIAIRVNPSFELKLSGMKMSGGAKPFGIDEEQIAQVLTKLPLDVLNLRGFHIYSGSQNLNADAIIISQQQTFALAQKLAENTKKITQRNIDYLNIGGGFGVPYFANQLPLDINRIANNLEQLLDQYHPLVDSTEIILELGRYLVAEAGIYVCKIIDKKVSRGTTYLVCNGGLHHHLANSGNFGQVIRKNYPVVIGNKLHNNDEELVNIVGPLCTPLDVIADKILLPKADIDDYVVVFQSGAYGASASPKDFLSQPSLAEILI
jgi:diaminopimelate decarboxylase